MLNSTTDLTPITLARRVERALEDFGFYLTVTTMSTPTGEFASVEVPDPRRPSDPSNNPTLVIHTLTGGKVTVGFGGRDVDWDSTFISRQIISNERSVIYSLLAEWVDRLDPEIVLIQP